MSAADAKSHHIHRHSREGGNPVLVGLALLLAFALPAHAQTADDRQRDLLRQTTLQLRQLQDENAALKAQQQSLTQQLQAAQTVAAGASAAVAPKPAADTAETGRLRRALAAESQRSAALQAQVEQFQTNQGRWQQAYQQAADLARSRDADAKKAEARFGNSDTGLKACTQNNTALVGIANDLLQRWQDKSVWASLKDSERLVGTHRIAVEKIAQDEHARIRDNTVRDAALGGDAAAPSPTPQQSQQPSP